MFGGKHRGPSLVPQTQFLAGQLLDKTSLLLKAPDLQMTGLSSSVFISVMS